MVLDIIFGFLLAYPPVLAITIFSIIVLFLINIFYKILIKQDEAKQLKARTKELSKQMRQEQKAGNTQKANELMSEMMRENSRMMRLTMKPMLTSFIIVILLLPWPAAHFGDTTAEIKDNAGVVTLAGKNHTFTVNSGEVNVEGATPLGHACDSKCYEIGGNSYEVTQEGSKLKFAPIVAVMPLALPLLGGTMGWLGWYIICSIPFVILMRKLMKIYV